MRDAIDAAVHADMSFLASDTLRGRGSATRDEHLAILFVAAQLQSFGLEPAAPDGTFVQQVPLPDPLPPQSSQRLAAMEDVPRTETWNAVAMLRGRDPAAGVLLLTAHADHLGVGPADASGDAIYNGADDDASGVTALLVAAQRLAAGPRPRRSVVFAAFGSEEIGGFGNQAFLRHPPVPLGSIVANIEFEMIGRPDPSLKPGELFLTGYERSDLGPTLTQHGAPLAPDPHPEQGFFLRSDNIALARLGIVAQTASSFGLHKDYHRPSDDLTRIDFAHMESAIAAMLPPLHWLAETTWRPQWRPHGRP